MAAASSSATLPLPDTHRYTVGWITALPVELAAATAMLDAEHGTLPFDMHDPNVYTLGRVGHHNVVIVCLPSGQTGLSGTTEVATRMLNKFRSLKIGFMIGVGGGIPSPNNDIRLGDVVVSVPDLDHGGVVQYDMGKAEAGGRFQRTGHLNTPPTLLLNVVNKSRANYELGRSTYHEHLETFGKDPKLRRYTRSNAGEDLLFEATYSHAGGSTCAACLSDMIVQRSPRDIDPFAPDNHFVEIHFGTIASGNRVIKDAYTRDQISRALGGRALCYEMEAAGLMNVFRCLVVRGICDYADSHKQKHWQRFAAATAAAYAKELLLLTPSADVASLTTIRPSDAVTVPTATTYTELVAPFSVPFSRNQHFVGQTELLAGLDKFLLHQTSHHAAIWGLGGCGKSAAVLEFVHRVREREPERAILWIRASDGNHFRQAFRDIAILYGVPGAQDLERDIMDAVKDKLMDRAIGKLLVVVDDVNDPSVLLQPDDIVRACLRDYLPVRRGSKVIFTTRDYQAADQLIRFDASCLFEIRRLDLEEARALFASITSQQHTGNERAVQILLSELSCLPLAIVQAAAFMRYNTIGVAEYLQLFRQQKPEDESTTLLREEFQDHSRYPGVANAITTTWQISFKQMQNRNTLAAESLLHLACIAPDNIPESLIASHKPLSRLERTKAIGILKAYQFLVPQRQDSLMDVNPLVHLVTKCWLVNEYSWNSYVEKSLKILKSRIPRGGYHKHNEYRNYLPHGLCVLGHVPADHDNANTMVDLLSRIAACQRDLGDYSSAEQSHQRVLDWCTEYLGEWDEKTLQAMQDVGQDSMLRGYYDEAEKVHRKTFSLRFKTLGPADVATLTSMRNIAEALGFQRKWQEYERVSTELAKLSRAWLGPTHPITLSSLKALSICYCQRGWFSSAEKLAKEVVAGREKDGRLGKTHPSTLKSISHLALVLGHSNRWEEAEELEKGVGTELQAVLGPLHPDTLTSRSNLARIWVRLNRLPPAQKEFEQILETRLNLLGPEHPDTQTSYRYVWRFCKDQQSSQPNGTAPVESPDPKRLVWTGHKSEEDLLCFPPVSEPVEGHEADVAKKLSGYVLSGSDEDRKANEWWSTTWVKVDRAEFIWEQCGDSGEALNRVWANLARIDFKERWSWLKQNVTLSQGRATPIPISFMSRKERGVPSAGIRSNFADISIYRAPLDSIQRVQHWQPVVSQQAQFTMVEEPNLPPLEEQQDPMIRFSCTHGMFNITHTRTITASDQRIVFGSNPDHVPCVGPIEKTCCPVTFDSGSINARHCEFWFEDRRWFTRDLGSAYGTFVNRQRLSSQYQMSGARDIKQGDVLQLGIDKSDREWRCIKIRITCSQGSANG